MRAIAAAIVLLSAAVAFGEHGHGLPHVSMRTQHGHTLHLKEWHGRVVVVNFWATWCKPCRSEIPVLQRLDSECRDLVKVVGIAVDAQGWRTVMPFLHEHSVTFPVALLSREMRLALGTGTASLPHTFVFDAEGRLAARFTAALEERDLLRIVRFAQPELTERRCRTLALHARLKSWNGLFASSIASKRPMKLIIASASP